ncbi:MAG TPA: hypothetical protein VFA88_11010 [Gaiellaceae bacterium]|nr:hypothetical protein [Gaiellaceae bacterium]
MQAPPRQTAAPFAIPKDATCADCYFRRQGLCALSLEQPCPTFRAAGRTLEPPQQARLVPRTIAVAY